MAKKNFMNKDPLSGMENKKETTPGVPVISVQTTTEEKQESPITEESKKRKPGRPKTKTEKCKTINIAIPLSVLSNMEIAKEFYSGNLTLYVETVIRKDLEANLDKYKQFVELKNSMNI